MKTLIIPILLLAAMGCVPPVPNTGGAITKFTIEGHDYLSPTKGGIIHSESCTNSACVPVKWDFTHPTDASIQTFTGEVVK